MSNNTSLSVQQRLGAIINDLDLDLNSELDQYEASLINNSALIAHSSIYDSSFSTNRDEDSIFYPSEDEAIPVASRLLEQPISMWDRVLTPWGIFGILIFLAANVFILFNFDRQVPVNNQANLSNQNSVNPNLNNQNNLPSSQQINSNNPQLSNNNNNVNSSEPDLKTTLFKEIESNSNQKNIPNNPNVVVKSNNVNESVKYYLLSDFQGNEQLETVQKTVPGATIVNVNQEQKIQLAIFTNQNEAQIISQQLKQKGVENYLYSPILQNKN